MMRQQPLSRSLCLYVSATKTCTPQQPNASDNDTILNYNPYLMYYLIHSSTSKSCRSQAITSFSGQVETNNQRINNHLSTITCCPSLFLLKYQSITFEPYCCTMSRYLPAYVLLLVIITSRGVPILVVKTQQPPVFAGNPPCFISHFG